MLRIAIVGLGPWGVCALERVVTTARQELRPGVDVAVHVIEPGTPGSGVYDVNQPDYLLLNNPCGELSLYPFEIESDQPSYAIGLYDWAVGRGYRWVGDRCAIDPTGQPIERHHFLPRRLMGEYLQWFYRALVSAAPRGLHIVHHPTAAVDLIARGNGTEQVRLANGGTVVVDHVIVTSGHTANEQTDGGRRVLNPYPVGSYVDSLPNDSTVAIAGMGLVAVDVLTALTIGRGGQFRETGDGLQYRPSGREPNLQLFCRSGLPFTAKSVTGKDRSDVYKPIICTDEALQALSGRSHARRRLVDLRSELLPLMFGEMSARYYAQLAFQASGSRADGAAVREQLRTAWNERRFDEALGQLSARFGSFDAEGLFFGHQPKYRNSDDYEQFVYDSLADDLREAEVPDGASPVKSAGQVFRIFRDRMRTVVEQGGLSLDSYLDFNADVCSRIHRLVAGPPALRTRQVLALMDAGIVRMPYGPAPAQGLAPSGGDQAAARTRISSTGFATPYGQDVDYVIRGHLEEPRIAGSASQLLTQLYDRGRVSQFRYGEVAVGSVDLTADSHPIDIEGRPQERISMFGVLTEGVRHFTAYIPSPRSRMRAVEDIGACVADVLADACMSEQQLVA
ncbi:MAG: FAD/NAD(P)-binding protein [Solirubrobacterales bacterium]|nr:FAD/NAD(P)-binding protein [Solirubrobacterales bacterium]